MHQYVAKFLTDTVRYPDGWPMWVTAEQKAWLIAKVKEVTGLCAPLTTHELAERVFDDWPQRWERIVLWDAQYAAVHRAALAAGMIEAWVPKQ